MKEVDHSEPAVEVEGWQVSFSSGGGVSIHGINFRSEEAVRNLRDALTARLERNEQRRKEQEERMDEAMSPLELTTSTFQNKTLQVLGFGGDTTAATIGIISRDDIRTFHVRKTDLPALLKKLQAIHDYYNS